MRLFNTIVVYDVYCVAENEEDARNAALANIVSGLPPSEQVARDVGRQPVRTAWLKEGPLVGDAVSEADFQKLKGKTTQDVWEELNLKSQQPTTSGEIAAKKSKAG